MDGLLLINKPSGCTSHDVVVQARRLVRQKKIGHCGTLDPDATGLLLLTLGRATRLTRFLIRAPKRYRGTVRFGTVTDTYDLQGEVTHQQSTEDLTAEQVEAALAEYVGIQLQTPPPYCAKKIGGVKYYELARRGEPVPDDKKEVTIYELNSEPPWQAGKDLRFELACSSGTYARSMAHELGQQLGCGGCLSSLERTQIGVFKLAEAIDLDTLGQRLEADQSFGEAFVPFDDISLPFDEVITDAQQERRIQHGQSVLVRELDRQEGDWIKLVNMRSELIAVGSVVERIGSGNVGVVQPKVVFHR